MKSGEEVGRSTVRSNSHCLLNPRVLSWIFKTTCNKVSEFWVKQQTYPGFSDPPKVKWQRFPEKCLSIVGLMHGLDSGHIDDSNRIRCFEPWGLLLLLRSGGNCKLESQILDYSKRFVKCEDVLQGLSCNTHPQPHVSIPLASTNTVTLEDFSLREAVIRESPMSLTLPLPCEEIMCCSSQFAGAVVNTSPLLPM